MQMKQRWWMVSLASLAMMLCLMLAVVKADEPPAAVDPAAEQKLADNQLAEHFCMLASQTMRAAHSPDQALPQCIALFGAAARLNPTEPRFARLLADAQLNAGDKTAAIQALLAYIALNHEDTFAQTQLVDLYQSQKQGVEKKLDYLKQVIGAASVAQDVRSFAAARAAKLLSDEQGDAKSALEMYQRALTFNPTNLEALRGKYDLSSKDCTPAERVAQLLAMLRANPSQPLVMTRLALHLGAAGLVNDSVNWFQFAMGLYRSTHEAPSFEFGQGAPAELFLADRPDDALDLLNTYLTSYPEDEGGWNTLLAITKWEVGRNPNDKAAQDLDDKSKLAAQAALFNRLQMVRKAMGVAGAATQPANATGAITIPDLSNDAALLKKNGNAGLANDYINAVQALAWIELYFRHDTASADPLLESLGTLLTDKDVALTRLRGWRRLVDTTDVDTQPARQKLSAVADRDPLAAMGLVMLDLHSSQPQTVTQAKLRAIQLLSANPSGALAAMLYGQFVAVGAKAQPGNNAAAITTLVNNFPSDWLNVLQHPENFYAIRVEPLQVTFDFGQPVLVKVTLQSINNYDITIGPEGVVHRDLWFDALLKGGIGQTIYGATFDRMGQALVLHPGRSISQIVRVDDQQLATIFFSVPQNAIPIDFTLLTNPISLADKKGVQAQSGMCGYRVTTMNPIERKPVVVANADAMKLLGTKLANGPADERMRMLMAVRLYVKALREDANLAGQGATLANNLAARIDHAISTDTNTTVRYWATYQQTFINFNDAQAMGASIGLLASSDLWPMRLLSLTVAPALPDKGQSLATLLANDGDANVKAYAAAMLEQLAKPSSRPSTQPSGTAP